MRKTWNMSMNLEITPLDDALLLMEINNAAVPDIGALDISKAQWLVERVVMPGLALVDGQVAGLVVVLSDSCGYNSDYYRWFTERYENFLYIDRVVVADWARGQGIAKQLYQAIEQAAHEQNMAIVADVHSDPPNTPSLNLHRTMGFDVIGTQYFPATKKTASKFMKYVERAKPKT